MQQDNFLSIESNNKKLGLVFFMSFFNIIFGVFNLYCILQKLVYDRLEINTFLKCPLPDSLGRPRF